jgi:hypothetical protein
VCLAYPSNCPRDPRLPIKLSACGGVACMHACIAAIAPARAAQGPGLARMSPAMQLVRVMVAAADS